MNDKLKLKVFPLIIIVALLFFLFSCAEALSNLRDYNANSAKLEKMRNSMRSTCSMLVLQNQLDEPAGERRAHLQEDIDSCKKEFRREL